MRTSSNGQIWRPESSSRLATSLGGSVSGEHGLGCVKQGQLEWQWAPHALDYTARSSGSSIRRDSSTRAISSLALSEAPAQVRGFSAARGLRRVRAEDLRQHGGVVPAASGRLRVGQPCSCRLQDPELAVFGGLRRQVAVLPSKRRRKARLVHVRSIASRCRTRADGVRDHFGKLVLGSADRRRVIARA
jgi:FAD linked oxidases, C-terminal domain